MIWSSRGHNQVWATDITYLSLPGGHAYLCARVMQRAIAQYGAPEIVNTDQGCQFTSVDFTQPLLAAGIKLSMDGKGRCLDNVFVERLWRPVKYEEVYLKSYCSLIDAHAQLDTSFRFNNERRPHKAHDGDAPGSVYRVTQAEAINQRAPPRIDRSLRQALVLLSSGATDPLVLRANIIS